MFTSKTQASSRIDVGYEVTITATHRQVCLIGGHLERTPVISRKGFVTLGIETLEERATPGLYGYGWCRR